VDTNQVQHQGEVVQKQLRDSMNTLMNVMMDISVAVAGINLVRQVLVLVTKLVQGITVISHSMVVIMFADIVVIHHQVLLLVPVIKARQTIIITSKNW